MIFLGGLTILADVAFLANRKTHSNGNFHSDGTALRKSDGLPECFVDVLPSDFCRGCPLPHLTHLIDANISGRHDCH